MTLAGPFFLIYIFWCYPLLFKKPLKLFSGILVFCAGLLPYLYIPIASRANPKLDWGNPETLERLLFHIQRKIYGDISIGGYPIVVKWKFISAYLVQFSEQYAIPLIIIGIIGAFCLYKKDLKFFMVLTGIFFSNNLLLIFIEQFPPTINKIMVMSVFYAPSYLAFACFIALGLSAIWEKLLLFISNYPYSQMYLRISVLLLFLLPLFSNYHENDLSKNYFSYDLMKNSLNSMEKNAIFFAEGDTMCFNVLYLQQVEKYRTDIDMYDNYGYLSNEYLGKDFNLIYPSDEEKNERRRLIYNKIIYENYSKRPIYFWATFNLGDNSDYLLIPYGLIYRVIKKGEDPKQYYNSKPKIEMRYIDDPTVYKDFRTNELLVIYWEKLGVYYDFISDLNNAFYCYERLWEYDSAEALNNAGLFFLKIGYTDNSIKYLKKAVKLSPDLYLLYYNLALAYEESGNKELAIKNYDIFCKNWDQDLELFLDAQKRIRELQNIH